MSICIDGDVIEMVSSFVILGLLWWVMVELHWRIWR